MQQDNGNAANGGAAQNYGYGAGYGQQQYPYDRT
jgi:hypothetical protein